MKVVINNRFGGFSLSFKALEWLWNKKSIYIETMEKEKYFHDKKDSNRAYKAWKNFKKTGKTRFFTIPFTEDGKYVYFLKDSYDKTFRSDSLLIECIETLKDKANGEFATLKIIEIPDGLSFEINDYDGIESIHEVHNSWC